MARGESPRCLGLALQLERSPVIGAAYLVEACLEAVVAQEPGAVGEQVGCGTLGSDVVRLHATGYERPCALVVKVSEDILTALKALCSPGIEEKVIHTLVVLHNIGVYRWVWIVEEGLRFIL